MLVSALLSVTFLAFAATDEIVISLDGDKWLLSDGSGRVKDVQATVPGQVHTTLYNQGIIKEPYYGWNDWTERWMAYDNWYYSLTFALTSEQVSNRSLYLRCGGLDTVANITMNGMLIGKADNFHRRWMFNIPNAKVGTNQINISFESAANYSVRMAAAYPYSLGRAGIYFNDSNRNFVRKPQSDFGWDWGPAFVPTGIWKNISIISFQDAFVDYVIPKTYFNDTDKSYYVSITVCVQLDHPANPALTVDVKMECPYVKTISGSFLVSDEGTQCGTLYSAPILPDDIESHLWWPNGVGGPDAKPTLLKSNISVAVLDTDKNVSTFSTSMNIGFRNIKVVQDPVGPNGTDGLTFYFMMSTVLYGDIPIYAKGSNFIPMDAFVTRVTPSYGRRVLQSAVDGNQNMIRVWGGGLYQTSWFYELCDELGLMVWQEFMFADALYPRDKDFLANVYEEVVHTVRRLGSHPSIVLWSGNNENQDDGESTDANLVDYSLLYDQTVRATLWKEDTTRPYWPSSPSNGAVVDDPERQIYVQRWGDSSNVSYGDIHRYDYVHYCTDVSYFPRPRFASEFGFQSYPSFNAMAKISTPSDWDNDSVFMKHRQHHPLGNEEIAYHMSLFFHMPNNTNRTVQFMDFIYLSQVVQGLCIKAEAEHYRRLLSEEDVLTRGTLYWQLNDIWQAQSWASIQYDLSWKILHHYMKTVYHSMLVSAYQYEGYIGVYVVNDMAPSTSVDYELHIMVVTWKTGSIVNDFKSTNTSKGFTGVRVFNERPATVFHGTSTTESFLYMTLADAKSGEQLATNWFFPSNFTLVQLSPPNIKPSNFKQTSATSATFVLSSSAVAPFVYLQTHNMTLTGNFNDNGFVMLPSSMMTYNMSFTSQLAFSASDLEKQLLIRTVFDTYSDISTPKTI